MRSLESSNPQRQKVGWGGVCQGLGEGWRVRVQWDRVSVWEDEKVLEMMVGVDAQQRECA